MVAACLAIISITVIRSRADKIPTEVEVLYVNYLEAISSDYSKAVDEYCHFEIPESEELTRQATDYVINYKITTWERLSDNLWAVNASLITVFSPEGKNITNFIGLIDDRYYVMTSIRQIPNSLKETVDFTPYISTDPNVITFEDIVDMSE